ncbi:MAG: acyl-CoA dehydrogenase family protein [Thermodesulfobacteriota bacterium]
MDFNLTEEQLRFGEVVASFVDKEVAPLADELDKKGEFPRSLFKRIGDLGYYGLRYPEEYGGANADLVTFCLFLEEMARGSLSVAANTAMQCLMGTHFLYRLGNEELKERLLKPALRGEKVAAFSLTEPGAGSDLGAMTTRAVRQGDHYLLNGSKTWLTSGTVADFITVAARTKEDTGLKGIALFLLERDYPGVTIGKKIPKLGVWGQECTELFLENCMVPKENLLGDEDSGFLYIKDILDEIRVITGALSLGLAQAALQASCVYAGERVAFGRPIKKFQGISFKLAEVATELEAARRLVYYAAWRHDQGLANVKEAAMAKLFASEVAVRAADESTRIFASYGFAMEYPAQRFFRDARFLLYGAGTSEILKVIISQELDK